MITIRRTDSTDPDFLGLIPHLDRELGARYGEAQQFYSQFNGVDAIRHVVVAYREERAVGCGAFKPHEGGTIEVKRMFVQPAERGRGIAARVLSELEQWAVEEGYSCAVLETGDKQLEAIGLYGKSGYERIPNYGQYAGVESSVCMRKVLEPAK